MDLLGGMVRSNQVLWVDGEELKEQTTARIISTPTILPTESFSVASLFE